MKPPVVVIERHCKTNQCRIAVRFKKIPSVAKISQSFQASAREEARANEFHSGVAGEIFIFPARAPSPTVLSLAVVVGLALVTAETVFAPRKKHQAERPVAPRVDRSVLPTVQSPSPPSLALQLALPVYKPPPNQRRRRPRPQLPALVSPQCGPRQQPHQSRLPCALLACTIDRHESIATSA
jgi:hypothetical protein